MIVLAYQSVREDVAKVRNLVMHHVLSGSKIVRVQVVKDWRTFEHSRLNYIGLKETVEFVDRVLAGWTGDI